MAKQPFAHMPGPGPVGRSNQKQNFFVFLIGLAVLSLLAGIFSQMITVSAQVAEQEALTFGPQTVGTQSASQTATFDNNTGVNMDVSVAVSGDFVITNNGCGTLAGSEGTTSCDVQVAFKPTAAGARTGQVTFNYSYDNGESTVSPSPSTIAETTVAGTTAAPTTAAPTTAAPTTSVPTTTVAGSPSPSIPGYGKGSNSGLSISQARPNAASTGSSSVLLQGTGVAAPTHTTAPNNCGSGIQGYVLIDGKAGAGVTVNLTGPTNSSVTVGDGGFFYFNDLCKGDYQISLSYDHSKYTANDADTRKITLDGVSGSRNNAFSLSTETTGTTAAPTTAAPTTAPSGTTAAPTTPAATTTPPVEVPTCAIPSGTVLRVCTATTQQSATHFALVIGVQAGDSPVNLNDTVILNLPAGVVINSATSAIGAVATTSSSSVRWGSFSLNPKQGATLVLSIDAPAGNLNGSSLFVSGSFNRSQAFQQRIPGLPGLTDIFPAVVATTGTGGQGGGVPSQAPATGVGQQNNQQAPVGLLILAAIILGGVGFTGLFLTGRNRKPAKKEQK